ncbi:reverse transcriptase [Gossypium australe]|uniref:Reverse transcriptase n=1 Tax=Gossypium australe TaxID=47621 RepID=A0A5B6VE65_9ROSI|nr:reverse transcriptase [Gossypium australe]
MADKRSDKTFEVGDLMYLKLQPYRHHTIRGKKRNPKLAPNFFGPFPVETRVGKVTYRLTLPPRSRVRSTFHKHAENTIHQPDLPIVGMDGAMIKEPTCILDKRMVKRGNKAVTEVLAEWTNAFADDATWENL